MAYLNQLQPANAMKPNLDVAARGAQKKKKKKKKSLKKKPSQFHSSTHPQNEMITSLWSLMANNPWKQNLRVLL